MRFHDREHAGRLLAVKVEHLGTERPVVLGLTRGGMPVAFAVARMLEAPLDLVVVRKLRASAASGQAIGAIAEGGATYVNPTVLREAGMPEEEAAAIAESESVELSRRVRLFRGEFPAPRLAGRTVIVVDDGVVTGASARAAARAARQRGAAYVVLAAPVISAEAEPEMGKDFDQIVAIEVASHLQAVGDWYERFEEVSDEEVLALVRRAHVEREAAIERSEPWQDDWIGSDPAPRR